MQSRAGRLGLLVALAAAAVALFIVLSDGGDDGGSDDETETTATAGSTATQTQPAEPPVEVIDLRGGAPVGGVKELEYTKGDRIRIRVNLDVPQEDVHIHGYDEEVLNPQEVAEFDFPANIEGGFELEAHGPAGDVALAELVVNPA